jgi:hypothetical protein
MARELEMITMQINWNDLRPVEEDKRSAFEEICCQLAAHEPAPQGSRFNRKGRPDSGVECYWTTPGGDEWAWQAKFFVHPPQKAQWQQLDDSVETALSKHPRLTLYYICLPIDRPDPRIPDQTWFMDAWNSHVNKWRQWAVIKGMSVEFIYWGNSEISERLAREEHSGRSLFWFDKDHLSRKWCSNHVDVAVSNAGPRYTPDLNVELPIAHIFDGLGRTPRFVRNMLLLRGEIKKAFANVRGPSSLGDTPLIDRFDRLQRNFEYLEASLEEIASSKIESINTEALLVTTEELSAQLHDYMDALITYHKERLTMEAATVKEDSSSSYDKYQPKPWDHEEYAVRQLRNHLRQCSAIAASTEMNVAKIPSLLFVGEAGTGKTHLFCDIARNRVASGLPTVLLMGEQFSQGEPWSQILAMLGLRCSVPEFLGSLEAAAEAAGYKALILIDALNEGEGKTLWRKHLAGIITLLCRHPWISIAVSVRTSYEDLVVPEGLVPTRLVREVHYGFSTHEYEATKTFFTHYRLQLPTTPLLVPEFQNPLFLKLFCKAIINAGLVKMPEGLEGITAIVNFFLDSVNDKLARPEYLDFNKKDMLVRKAVDNIAMAMAESGQSWLLLEDAQRVANIVLQDRGYESSLFRHLLSEGVLAEDRLWIEDGPAQVVRFAYERFTDHLIVRNLLDRYLDRANPATSFGPGTELHKLVQSEYAIWMNRGLIEALAIQLPERIGQELPHLVPSAVDYSSMCIAFVQSVIWRDRSSFSDYTLQYISQHVVKDGEAHDLFLDALLTVASDTAHPYNAEYLHKILTKQNMADRDSWWSKYIFYDYGSKHAVDRLLDWAWDYNTKGNTTRIADEPIHLCAIALTWFLTTSNRFLRDRATKALVSMLTHKLHVVEVLLDDFKNAYDPYISERLYAVAYGCAMRSLNQEAIQSLGHKVYNLVFSKGMPPPHILLRDYARGTVELALTKGLSADALDLRKIRPPYGSIWDESEIPTAEGLEPYSGWPEGLKDQEYALHEIYHSLFEFGDFARYVVEPNVSKWSSQRLGQPHRPSRKQLYQQFVASLTSSQQRAFTTFKTVRDNIHTFKRCDATQRAELFGVPLTDEQLDDVLAEVEARFRKRLGKRKSKIFVEHVLPTLDYWTSNEDLSFDPTLAQRWMFNKILNMGWTVERFGTFDRAMQHDNMREAHKAERIGKKYQWIALHECLARIADNFIFNPDRWSDPDAQRVQDPQYSGAWQISVRDIDPSLLLTQTQEERSGPYTHTWWFPPIYTISEVQEEDWAVTSEDLPDFGKLIEVERDLDNTPWLALQASYSWEEPVPPDIDRHDHRRKTLHCSIRSILVSKQQLAELTEWAIDRQNLEEWITSPHDMYDIFLGEFFWAPSYLDKMRTYYNDLNPVDSPTTLLEDGAQLLSLDNKAIADRVPIMDIGLQYIASDTDFDCSLRDHINIELPAVTLVKGLDLAWRGQEGRFFRSSSSRDQVELVAMDPSVHTRGPGALLIRKSDILDFLRRRDLAIIWTVFGEKDVIGGWDRKKWDRLYIRGTYWFDTLKVEGILKTFCTSSRLPFARAKRSPSG